MSTRDLVDALEQAVLYSGRLTSLRFVADCLRRSSRRWQDFVRDFLLVTLRLSVSADETEFLLAMTGSQRSVFELFLMDRGQPFWSSCLLALRCLPSNVSLRMLSEGLFGARVPDDSDAPNATPGEFDEGGDDSHDDSGAFGAGDGVAPAGHGATLDPVIDIAAAARVAFAAHASDVVQATPSAIDCCSISLLVRLLRVGDVELAGGDDDGKGWFARVRDLVARYPSKSSVLSAIPLPYHHDFVTLLLGVRWVQFGVFDPLTALRTAAAALPACDGSLSWCIHATVAAVGHRHNNTGAVIESLADWCLSGAGAVSPADAAAVITDVLPCAGTAPGGRFALRPRVAKRLVMLALRHLHEDQVEPALHAAVHQLVTTLHVVPPVDHDLYVSARMLAPLLAAGHRLSSTGVAVPWRPVEGVAPAQLVSSPWEIVLSAMRSCLTRNWLRLPGLEGPVTGANATIALAAVVERPGYVGQVVDRFKGSTRQGCVALNVTSFVRIGLSAQATVGVREHPVVCLGRGRATKCCRGVRP